MARNTEDKTAPAETPAPEPKTKEPTDPHARFKTTLPNGTTLYNFVS